ncbi:MAG: NUDIX hydrolase [Armatimonadetes bacterium]|nr:NUDIX hydrolase [Armatimonadota bacterium]
MPDPSYVLVFAWSSGQVLLSDILGRGWCVPSGRVEPGESAEIAVRRELLEESGCSVGQIMLAGEFVIGKPGEETVAHAFVAQGWTEEGPPTGNDSQGRRACALDELPTIYFEWNSLYEAVFAFTARLASE